MWLTDFASSYDRGQLMPLYRGAPPLVILAHTPIRNLKRGSLRAHQNEADPHAAWRLFRRQCASRAIAADICGLSA